MTILPVSDAALELAVRILKDGGVVAHPTETCYGFACDLRNPVAVERVFHLKIRPPHQPVSGLFPSVEDAKRYVEWNEKADELAGKHLPGPLTLILPLRSDAPVRLYSAPIPGDTLGVRVSSSEIAGKLVTAFGSPLSTTSANVHGLPNPYSAEDVAKQFGNSELQPDLILDGGQLPPTPPSTVVNLSDGDAGTLRKGEVTI